MTPRRQRGRRPEMKRNKLSLFSIPYVVWMAIIYVVVNLITDILYHVLDPRIRLGVQGG